MAIVKGVKIIAENRKAFHDYFIEEKYECGIVLSGTEVKSLLAGQLSLHQTFLKKEFPSHFRTRKLWGVYWILFLTE